MSWSQILSDVTSRIQAASQGLQADLQHLQTAALNSAHHQIYSSHSAVPTNPISNSAHVDSQSSSMSVRIQLDQQNAPFYTNLDIVTGQVLLNLSTDTAISAINVKLEGESRTRLSGPGYPNDPRNRQRIELEVHKVLYKVQTVFPSADIAQKGGNVQYTLPAGQYRYRFSFKIPFNNECTNKSNTLQDLRLGPFLGADPAGVRHVKQTLPPTLGGFPGEADIKYFVKATVIRPKFYHGNIRSITDINFQPIEPPRPGKRLEETYARRQHHFPPISPIAATKSSLGSLLKKASSSPDEGPPLSVKVDARLPSPAIISCHQPVPLRILVDKTSESLSTVYLSLLQVELIGYTQVRAYDLTRTETGSWILMSRVNMNLPLDKPADTSGKSFEIPSSFWDTISLPSTVTPSFRTCNLSRSYELEVRVGISCGPVTKDHRPEMQILPLRIPVEVYSGVAPSATLLHRISTHQPLGSNLTPPRPNNAQHQHSPITPMSDMHPPQSGSYIAPPLDDYDDLPPSYEDALAEDVAPIDGPRREYIASGALNSTRQITQPDSKQSSGLGRHGSERLFEQNAPAPPGLNSLRSRQPTFPSDGNMSCSIDEGSGANPHQKPAPPLPKRTQTTESTKSKQGKK